MKAVQCVDCVRAQLQIACWRISIRIFFFDISSLLRQRIHDVLKTKKKKIQKLCSFLFFLFSFVNCQKEEEEEEEEEEKNCLSYGVCVWLVSIAMKRDQCRDTDEELWWY